MSIIRTDKELIETFINGANRYAYLENSSKSKKKLQFATTSSIFYSLADSEIRIRYDAKPKFVFSNVKVTTSDGLCLVDDSTPVGITMTCPVMNIPLRDINIFFENCPTLTNIQLNIELTIEDTLKYNPTLCLRDCSPLNIRDKVKVHDILSEGLTREFTNPYGNRKYTVYLSSAGSTII